MSNFIFFSEKVADKYVNKRAGETKLGEALSFVKSWEELKNSDAIYALIGIPEDIGVRANLGKNGAAKAWEATLQSFLNIQNNQFTNVKKVVVLGNIDCATQLKQASEIENSDLHSAEILGELVVQIDHKVSEIIRKIVEAGKIPIIIGGGHNNSYGNLKGTSDALGKKLNCINFDAHTDFRSLEHRHSGNGFSYAFENGYLERYFIFGLHRNYTSQEVFNELQKNDERIKYIMYETIKVSEEISFPEALQQSDHFCCGSNFGLELDLDAIENFGSSAMTPSGFTFTEARKFVRYFSENKNCNYIHICEGAPEVGIFKNQVGKAISYLISDIITN